VLISSALWRRRYGSDPQVLRRAVSIDGVPHDIVGVLPSSFHFPKLSDLYPLAIVQDRPQIWKPLALRPHELAPISDFNFVALGRLTAGVSAAQAALELDAVQKRLSVELPKILGPADLHAHVLPLHDRIIGRAKTGLELTLAAVGVVLLVGSVNITNLLLARLSTRRRELAVRAAIGAGRARLVRQMLAESLTLATVGGVCGALIAVGGIRLILALAPADLPRLDEVHLDTRSFLFAAVISTVVGVVISVSAAWQFGTGDPGEVVASGTRSTAGRRTGRLRSLLVGAQVALSGVSLITGGLLAQSLVKLLNVDRGFDSADLITVAVNLGSNRYPTTEKQVDFVHAALERLQVLPGAVGVAAANMLPLAGAGSNSVLTRPATTVPLFDGGLANIRIVNSDYFRTMGMSLQAGRLFTDADRERQVAVVSSSLAKRAWPGEDPIGKRFHFGLPTIPDKEVLGVVNDVRGVSLEAGPSVSVYLPYWQGLFALGQGPIGGSFAVKTTRDPMTMAPAIRAAVHSIDAELPLSAFRTMEDVVRGSVSQRRFQASLVLMFAAAAVLLASLGIYGVLSYAVTQRTTEIGIRLALGAEPRAVRRMVLRQALRPVVLAIASAVPLALLAGSWLRSLLFGVSPRDPNTIGAACLALITAAALAAYLPARRAANLDPLTALRHE
jgi:putative ABC transport system permease protein